MTLIRKIAEFIRNIFGISHSKISIDKNCAAIIINPNEIDLIMPEIQEDTVSSVSATVGYIIYTIERQDWMSEYIAFLDAAAEKERVVEEEEEKERDTHA